MRCFAKKKKTKKKTGNCHRVSKSHSIMFILSPPVFYLEAADEAEMSPTYWS